MGILDWLANRKRAAALAEWRVLNARKRIPRNSLAQWWAKRLPFLRWLVLHPPGLNRKQRRVKAAVLQRTRARA